ncbi:MAG: MoaD/ThiS family protein [Desulfobacterota bacterium]|nr:MoaD/ThiS family protein [Thermodesulfobacteriota bacterium]
MKVEVKLFTVLQKYAPGGIRGQTTVECPGGETIGQLLNRLSIPQTIPLVILVNGVQKGRDDVLQDGDRLDVFPPIAGG